MAEMNRRGMNRRIEAFFDGLAPTWDEEIASRFADRLNAMVDALPISPGQTVLDVGAGTGILAGVLASRVAPNGRVIAVDLSRAMLRDGKTRRPTPASPGYRPTSSMPPSRGTPSTGSSVTACFPTSLTSSTPSPSWPAS